MRNTQIKSGFTFGLAMLGVTFAFAQKEKQETKPNVIFILADDMGIGDVSCYGSKIIQTPNIDRLAQQGMKFANHYTGGPVSAPSRCCLMTGKHTGHSRIRQNHSAISNGRVSITPNDTTVAMIAKQAGYKTAIYGKWGLAEPNTSGIPNEVGFDDWMGYLNQDHAEFYYTNELDLNRGVTTIEANNNGKKGEYSNDIFTGKAKSFIKANKDDPFFLYLAYTIPHALMQVPMEDRVPFMGKFVNDGHAELDSVRSIYTGMITRLDRQIGEIMSLLEYLGIDEKTLVIFSSDNGATLHSLKVDYFDSHSIYRGYKGDLYEGGIHTPMIARWKSKIQPGSVTDHISAFWDFLPTFAEIAGVSHNSKIDGISYLPILLGKPVQQKKHDYLYWEFTSKSGVAQAVRIGDYKVIRSGNNNPAVEVYNLLSDPGESKDISSLKPALVKQGLKLFKDAHTENEDYPLRATSK